MPIGDIASGSGLPYDQAEQYSLAQAQLQNAMAQQAQNVLAKSQWPPAAVPPVQTRRQELVELSSRAREQFVSRMGGVRSKFFVLDTDCVYTHVTDERVILFYCFSGKEGVTSEPVDVFPSDQLIAQFRMMLA